MFLYFSRQGKKRGERGDDKKKKRVYYHDGGIYLVKKGEKEMKGRKIPDEKRIMREMAEIAFSEEEKASDRLRALGFLAERITEDEERETAMKRLDEVLEQIGL